MIGVKNALVMAAALAAIVAVSPLAQAQQPAQPRGPCLEGTCDGFDVQPSAGETQRLEQQDGVAQSPAQQQREDAELNKLYKELESGQPGNPPPGPVSPLGKTPRIAEP